MSASRETAIDESTVTESTVTESTIGESAAAESTDPRNAVEMSVARQEQEPLDADLTTSAAELFLTHFGFAPDGVWSAPGRVNFIGEHVDYAGGRCLPFALNRRTWCAANLRSDGRIRIVSTLPQTKETRFWEGYLSDVGEGKPDNWAAYAAGSVWAVTQDASRLTLGDVKDSEELRGRVSGGVDLALVSNVPLGAGLSSSAAVELSVSLAVMDLAGFPLPSLDTDDGQHIANHVIDACISAENIVAQAATGGLDQIASLFSRRGMALDLDMSTRSVTYVPFDPAASGLGVLVMDTNTPHSLHDGQYADRRSIIDQVSDVVNQEPRTPLHRVPHAVAKAVTWAQKEGDTAQDVTRIGRSVRHVVSESGRTIQCIDVLSEISSVVGSSEGSMTDIGWRRLGQLLNQSHTSLQLDYEVSCPELDSAVYSSTDAGALGARMVGGGFGGSAIALAPLDEIDTIMRLVSAAAQERGFPQLDYVLALPSEGARRDL